MFKSRNASIWQNMKNILWPKKGFQRPFVYLRERIMRMSASTHSLSLGLACGAAASMTPFLGFHFLLGALLAFLMRANLFASAIGTVIGNPWSFPLIWAADIYVGDLIVRQFGIEAWLVSISGASGTDISISFFYSITLGGLILALGTFPIYYGLSYWGLSSWRSHRQKRKAERAVAAMAKEEPVAPTISAASSEHKFDSNITRTDEKY